MPPSRSDNFQVAPHALWATTIAACKTALSLLSYYENGDFALVNATLRPLQQLVELGSNFEEMKQVERIPGLSPATRRLRDVKRIQFDPKEKWDIVSTHEVHVPLKKGEYITATLIDTVQALDAILPELQQAKKIAIDCEFLGEKKKDPEVKCIQLAHSSRKGYTIVIDSIGVDVVLSKLQRILSSPKVMRLGWSYFADASAMERLFDITVGRTLDLQAKLRDVGGQIFNLADAVTAYAKSWEGYERFMEAKGLSSSFHFTGKECVWLQRPLPPAALVYSVFDVVSLCALYDATNLELTLPNHYWPECHKPGQAAKTPRNHALKAGNDEDKMEEFEFDPYDEDFRQLPREQPLGITEEERQYLGDLSEALKLSMTEETKLSQTGSQDKGFKSKKHSKTSKSLSKFQDNDQPSKVDSRSTELKVNKSNTRKTISERNYENSKDEEDDFPITHYNLAASKPLPPSDSDAVSEELFSDVCEPGAEIPATFGEDENVEMWKGFALKQWSMKESVPITPDGHSQWQSPNPRSPAKEAKSLPKMDENKSPQVYGNSPAGKRDNGPHDKKNNSNVDKHGSSSYEDYNTSDDGSSQSQLPKAKAKNLHPIVIQKNQAISEDDYDSTMRLDDESSLQLHTINSPKRLEEMKLTDANRALQSPVAILGQFQETSSKKRVLHAVQLLTATNDAYTILLDSAIPNPDAIHGTLFEHIITSPNIERVTWDFDLLAEHLHNRLGIQPGKTLCLSYKLATSIPGMPFISAMNILKSDWIHMPYLSQLNFDRSTIINRKKFVDYWAKPLPPQQLIRAGVLELKGYLDMSSEVSHFDSVNLRTSDYWAPPETD